MRPGRYFRFRKRCKIHGFRIARLYSFRRLRLLRGKFHGFALYRRLLYCRSFRRRHPVFLSEQPVLKSFPELPGVLITVLCIRSAGFHNDFLKLFIAAGRLRQSFAGYPLLIGDPDPHPALHTAVFRKERPLSPVQQHVHDHAEGIDVGSPVIIPGPHQLRRIP